MTIRWGIVTAGKISHDFVNAFNTYPNKGDQVIAAVAARDKTRAAEFAETHNIAKVFDSYQNMANSNDIDVAYIGALNPEHYPLAKMFLESGKNVLCEKPLCMNYKQAESLINIAKRKKIFLMEAVWSRFSPAYAALEEKLKAGVLGDVQFLDVNFGVTATRSKEFGGGVVLDIGVYPLQLAQLIFKEEPIKVAAVGQLSDDGVDLVDTIVLDYNGGKRAVLNLHGRLALWNRATIVGTKGRITLEEPFHFPHKVINEEGVCVDYPLHTSGLPYNFPNSPGLVYQALEVARCIKEGLKESPKMSHKESLILAKLEDTIRKQVGVHFDVDVQEFP